MRVSRKLVRRATVGALVVGLSTPVAASAAPRAHSLHLSLPGRQAVVHVTQQDAGRTIHISQGTLVVVKLRGSYDPPTVDRPEVLREVNHSGGYPSSADAKASFTAVSTGSAVLSGRIDMACMHTNPHCMIMTAPMRVTFVVGRRAVP
jgi:hypothetical protein